MSIFNQIKVLELGRVFSAPLCGMTLSDLGAQVIKVERPGIGDESRQFGRHFAGGNSCYFNALNRNKQSVALDLKNTTDRATFTALVQDCDVFIHNWLQPSLDKLGFSYDAVKALNPTVIYCAISGYGSDTSRSAMPSQDIIAQAVSGFMSLTGEAGGVPLKTGIPVVDYVTGLNAAFVIMSALYMRQVTGEGQLVSTSLLESAVAMTSFASSAYLSLGVNQERRGNRHPYICPYNVYRTTDGAVTLAIANDAMWERFCRVLGLEALWTDPRFTSNGQRLAHQDALVVVLEPALAQLTTAELVATLNAHRVSCTKVNSIAEAFASEAVRELAMVTTFEGEETVAVVGKPFHLEKVADVANRRPPGLGEAGSGRYV